MDGIWSELMVGSKGTFIVNTSTKKTANANALFVSAGTVITRIEKNGDAAIDVKSELGQDLSIALLSDVLLTLATGYISAVQITAGGQVVMILR